MLRVVPRLFGFCSLGEKEFLQLAEREFDRLTTIAEKYEQEQREMDVSNAYNKLSVRAGSHAVVVNTQTPNRQLWYSSTLSGPQRYNWEKERWLNGKQRELAEVFEEDVRAMLKS